MASTSGSPWVATSLYASAMDCCAPATSVECKPPSMCTMALPSCASAFADSSVKSRPSASRREMSLYLSSCARFCGDEMMAISQSSPRVVFPTEMMRIRFEAAASLWK